MLNEIKNILIFNQKKKQSEEDNLYFFVQKKVEKKWMFCQFPSHAHKDYSA